MEEEDRHVVLWRKEDPPSEDEINCLKAGKAWDADAFEREKQEKLRQDILNEKEHKERLKNEKVCISSALEVSQKKGTSSRSVPFKKCTFSS